MPEDEILKSIALTIMTNNSSLICNHCAKQISCKYCDFKDIKETTCSDFCKKCGTCAPENLMSEFVSKVL